MSSKSNNIYKLNFYVKKKKRLHARYVFAGLSKFSDFFVYYTVFLIHTKHISMRIDPGAAARHTCKHQQQI